MTVSTMCFFVICHTLQDFYSHSNWVELGNVEPFRNLLQADLPLENLAGVCQRSQITRMHLWVGLKCHKVYGPQIKKPGKTPPDT